MEPEVDAETGLPGGTAAPSADMARSATSAPGRQGGGGAGDVLELTPTTVVAGGDALARDPDGRVVLVAGALPGERVAAAVTERRRDFARAHVVDVLDPSSDRVAPPCPAVAAGCGGCDWQHVAVDAQRRLKAAVVRDALRRLGRLADPVVDEGAALPVGGHRTTVRMVVAGGRLAFRRAGTHEPVPVDECLVAHPLLTDLLPGVDPGEAGELTLRCGARTGDRLVLASPTARGVRAPDGVVVVGTDELAAGRRAWFTEELAGRRWRVSARSFLQARPDGAEALVDAVRREVAGAPDGRLVDAYGGIGLFAGTVGDGRPTTVLEWAASSVADARVNVPAAKVLRIDVARWRPSRAAVVVADPARAGLGRRAAEVLAGTGAGRLVLVSCDPASLGRDTALLAGLGFEHERSTLVDLFPHTSHVEVVSSFRRDAASTATAMSTRRRRR